MKRPRETSDRPQDAPLTASERAFFEAHGYLLLPHALTSTQLRELRDECDGLYAQTTADELVDLGCVLDIFASANRNPRSRVDEDAYTAQRDALVNRPLSSDLKGLLFHELPVFMQALLSPGPDQDEQHVYFFNEHYVVKPPQSKVEFRWHQDDTEQLGMCVHRETIPWYISAWIALDDVTATNGALQFRPLGNAAGATSEPILAPAGTILVFRSDVWHFSAANTSDSTRRAFYVQYSRVPITTRPSSGVPLCCAIPLLMHQDPTSKLSKRSLPDQADGNTATTPPLGSVR